MKILKNIGLWIQLGFMLAVVATKNTYYRLTGQKEKIISDV